MSEYHLKTPIKEEEIRKLRVDDIVYLSGTIVTARDTAHKRILEYYEQGKPIPIDLRGGVIYHCGPVVLKRDDEWVVIAAGPTTSTRMELYEASIIEKFGIRMIIGKGGMGVRTAEACRRYGAVYTVFTGGAAVLAARAIKRVLGVEWLDLGVPEALWILEVEEFGPLLVVIDSTGRNLIEEIIREARKRRDRVFRSPSII